MAQVSRFPSAVNLGSQRPQRLLHSAKDGRQELPLAHKAPDKVRTASNDAGSIQTTE